MPDAADARRAGRDYFATDPSTLAQRLLGARLCRRLPTAEVLRGAIVETEAYLGVDDLAAHSAGWRRTARTEPMYGPPGTIYVFQVYGMHHCLNFVCGAVDEPVAVLIRAVEPIDGIETMRRLRQSPGKRPLRDRDLCSGPGRLCGAFGIDRAFDGRDIASEEGLWLEPAAEGSWGGSEASRIGNSARVGVEYAGAWADKPLRWFVRDSIHVSRARPSGAVAKRPDA